MARNKTLSQNIALLVGQVPATGAHGTNLSSIWALQSVDYDWSQTKEDVSVYGLFAPIERVGIDAPEVTLNFSYNLGNGTQETALGLETTNGAISALSTILDKSEDEKNYFVFVAPEGQDAVGLSGASSNVAVVGIGNGFISSYGIEGSVGSVPVVSVTVQALNMKTYTGGVSQPIPAINPTTGLEITGQTFTIPTVTNQYTGANVPNVIKPGDISLTLSNAGGLFHDFTTTCIQSFSINFDLNRQPLQCLGSRFAFAREITPPVNVNFEVEMYARDIVTGSLASFLCSSGVNSARLSFKRPNCSGQGAEALGIQLKNISLEGQSWSTSVGGDPQTVTTRWVSQVSASGDTFNGLFMSGS